jgi:pilus assembly protein CpaD
MARSIIALALVASSLSLGGCINDIDQALTPHMNPTIHSVNEPVVQRTDYVFDLPAGGGATASDLGRLDAWFESLQIGYGDRVSVDTAGYGNDAVRNDVARVAGAYGLLVSDGAPITSGAIAPGSVRVVVSRTAATVPGCPIWDASEIGARITTSPNYGCAVNSNLAAMIADPNDLVAGQAGATSVDAATSSKAIRTYRTKAPTGAGEVKQESSKAGS